MDILDFYHYETERDENGTLESKNHEWRTFGDLAERLEEIIDAAGEIQHVRWKGIPNHREKSDVLPYCDHLAVDVQRHWHDCIPKIRIYGLQWDRDAQIHHAEYLYGIVYDPSSAATDWEDAFQLAGKFRGALCPNGEDYRHPEFDDAR